MKTITRLFTLCAMMTFLGVFTITAQESPSLNTDRGTGWSEQTEPLVLSLNFQDYEHFHSQANEDSSNSRHNLDPEKDPADPDAVILGYKDMVDVRNYIGSNLTVTLDFNECAFAPEWQTAYGFSDSQEGENTENVSNGFVEISRDWDHGGLLVTQGYFTIDLGNMEYIAALQYTTSSAGGNRRGFSLEYSIDSGVSWDTLRWQPGDQHWAESFTASPYTNERTPNGYRCDGSGFGLVWEDNIYFAPDEGEHFMVRFTIASNQVHRVHDFKVYGDLKTETFIDNLKANTLSINGTGSLVQVSKVADISVFNLAGSKVKSISNNSRLSIVDLPAGIYVVRASAGNESAVAKIIKK